MTLRKNINPAIWMEKYTAVPFSGVSSNEPYAVGDDPLEASKRQIAFEKFLNSPDEQAPSLDYPLLDEAMLRSPESAYYGLLDLADKIGGVEGDLLYERAATKLAELYRHKEVIRGLGSTGVAKARSSEQAATMSLEVFGEPQYEDFSQLLAALRRTAQSHESVYAGELLELIGSIESSYASPNYELHDETIELLHEDIISLYPALQEFAPIDKDDDTEIAHEDALITLQAMLDSLHMDGWKAVFSEKKAIETNAAKKEIRLGKNRPLFTAQTLYSTSIHEIIGHAMRSHNALKQEDPLKQGVFPGNLEFEEGLATGLEQVFGAQKRIAGEQYYLSLGLQQGLDQNGKKRTFREVYEILWRRLLVIGSDTDATDAKNKAYTQVMRTTRGGSLDARDISYFNGSKSAYAWLNDIAKLSVDERREKLSWALSAKFDPTDPASAAVMNKAEVV